MMSLFDYADMRASRKEVKRVTNEAIERVRDHADPAWMKSAREAVIVAASHNGTFTTDDVWATLEAWKVDAPHEPRALGAVMRQLQRAKVITSTGTYRKSRRVECHGRPMMVWAQNGSW